jgi:hypothetical protein
MLVALRIELEEDKHDNLGSTEIKDWNDHLKCKKLLNYHEVITFIFFLKTQNTSFRKWKENGRDNTDGESNCSKKD